MKQIQWWIWEKQLFKTKIQRLVHGNPSMNSTTTTYYTHFLPCSLFSHISFMNNTLSHIKTNSLSHTPSPPSSSSLSPKKHSPFTHLVNLPWPFLELVPLIQWKFQNPSLQSMASSSSKNQWELKMICPPIDFRMRIFGPNEIQKKFHPPIK